MLFQRLTEAMNRRNNLLALAELHLAYKPGDVEGAKELMYRYTKRAQGIFTRDMQLTPEWLANQHQLTRLFTPLMAAALRGAENVLALMHETVSSYEGFKKAFAPVFAYFALSTVIGGGLRDTPIIGDLYNVYRWYRKATQDDTDPLAKESPDEYIERSLYNVGGRAAVDTWRMMINGLPDRLLHKNMTSDNTIIGFLDGIAISKAQALKNIATKDNWAARLLAAANFISTTAGRAARAAYQLYRGHVVDSNGQDMRPYSAMDAALEVMMGRDTRDTDALEGRSMGGGRFYDQYDVERFVKKLAQESGIVLNPGFSRVMMQNPRIAEDFRMQMLNNWDNLREQANVRATNLLDWIHNNPRGQEYKRIIVGDEHYGNNEAGRRFDQNLRRAVMDYYSVIAIMQTFDQLNQRYPGNIHGAFKVPGMRGTYLYRARDVLAAIPDYVFVVKRLTDALNRSVEEKEEGVQ